MTKSITLLLGEEVGHQNLEIDLTGSRFDAWNEVIPGIRPEDLGIGNCGSADFISGGPDGMVYEVAGIITTGDFALTKNPNPRHSAAMLGIWRSRSGQIRAEDGIKNVKLF